MSPEEIDARAQISNLVERYVAGVDGGPIEDLVSLFAPDGALISHGGLEARGHAEIDDYLRRSRASRGGSTFGRIRHHLTRSRLDLDGERGTATAYFTAFSKVGVDHWGIYDDELVRIDGAWLFQTRTVTLEGASPDGWIGSGAAVVKFTPQ